jgi:hypothetical protein
MSGIFRNIDPPPPHRPASVYPLPRLWYGGEDTLAGWGGGGGSEDARHCSELYISKYFVQISFRKFDANMPACFTGTVSRYFRVMEENIKDTNACRTGSLVQYLCEEGINYRIRKKYATGYTTARH